MSFEIRIPGKFVVLQGVSGDGLINTMDTLPSLETVMDDQEDMISPNSTSAAAVPLNVIGSSMQRQGLFPSSAPSSRGNTAFERCCDPVVRVDAGLEDSFIVVQDNDDEEVEESRKTPRHCQSSSPQQPLSSLSSVTESLHTAATAAVNNTTYAHAASVNENLISSQESEISSAHDNSSSSNNNYNLQQQQAVAQWKADCQQKLAHDYEEWQETCNANHRTAGNMVTLQDSWWLSEGHLALLDRLPSPTSGTPQTLGQLAPGTTLMATQMYTLDSKDWTPIPAEPNAEGVFPMGREGWLQVLETEDRHYVLLSRNGYSFLEPGTPDQYTDPLNWIWRVTCIDGAFVREGLDLSTHHICTIPYGSLVRVLRKTVNAMGLSRLQVAATLPNDIPVEGWCSEFLNPLSGQRGSIVQPLPFCVPATYRVALSTCAVIRSGIELSSPEIGYAPSGALLTIVGRIFSEHPTERCIERLRLAGDGGWISLRLNKNPPNDLLIAEQVGVDPSFDPGQAGVFHWTVLKKLQEQEELRESRGIDTSPQTISSVEDDEGLSASSASSSLASCFLGDTAPSLPRPSTTTTTAFSNPHPCCTYTRGTSTKSLKSEKSDSQYHRRHHHHQQNQQYDESSAPKCLICLSEDRTATLVHGGTGHIACCLMCARILKARGDPCPVCRLPIDLVIQHFWA